MTKHPFILIGVCIAGFWIALLAWFLSSMIRDGFHSRRQMQALQSRSDYPQIAAACIRIVHSVTNQEEIALSDARVSETIRALRPSYILAESNYLTMEFHGGFDHYGFRLEQSATNSERWTLLYYTEESEKPLTTISDD